MKCPDVGKCGVGGLTSADGPVVTPRSQCVGDSLAGDALGSLQDVAVIAAELDAGAHPVHGDAKKMTLVREKKRPSLSSAFPVVAPNPCKKHCSFFQIER